MGGCATPKEHPILEVASGGRIFNHGIGVFATTAERRAVVVHREKQIVCAEPPPDAGENIISNLTSALQVAVKADTKEAVDLKHELTRNIDTTIVQLIEPAQTLTAMRNGWYVLCQSEFNRAALGGDKPFGENYQGYVLKLFNDSQNNLKDEITKRMEVEKIKANVLLIEKQYDLEKLRADTLKAEAELLKQKKPEEAASAATSK